LIVGLPCLQASSGDELWQQGFRHIRVEITHDYDGPISLGDEIFQNRKLLGPHLGTGEI
jgi:hypothetical protein